MITVVAIIAGVVLGINAVGITALWAIKSIREYQRNRHEGQD